jgi:cytoskeletal protein CcmA (bactofilin family)
VGKIISVDSDEWTKLKRRIRRLETRSQLGNTSVTGGQTEFNGEESVAINGSGRVTGTLNVDGVEIVEGRLLVNGTLIVSGSADFTGPLSVQGELNITGATTFIGPLRLEGESTIIGAMTIEGDLTITGETTITGPLDVTGDVTFTGKTELNGDTKLTGDLAVVDDGVINVAKMKIGPAYNGGDGGIYSEGTFYLGAEESVLIQVVKTITLVSNDGITFRGGPHTFAGDGVRILNTPKVPANSTGWAPVLINTQTGLLAQAM